MSSKLFESIRKRRRFILLFLCAVLLYSLAAIVLTYPLVTNPGRYYFNPEIDTARASGDGIGEIASIWREDNPRESDGERGPATWTGYPFKPAEKAFSYPLSDGVTSLFSRWTGPQAAFNIFMLISFPLAGAAMFGLVYHVTRSGTASLLGGFLFAFSPWHVYRSFENLSLSAVYCLPLFTLALILFWERRDLLTAALLAAAGAIAVLTDIHMGLFCALLAVAWPVSAYLTSRGHPGRARRSRGGPRGRTVRVAALGLMAAAAVILVAVPVYRNILSEDPAVTPGAEGRSIDEAVAYSARPADYFIPPEHTILWRHVTYDTIARRTAQGLPFYEVSLYPGIVTAGLAIFGVVSTWKKKRRRRNAPEAPAAADGDPVEQPEDGAGQGRDRVLDTTVCFGVVTAVIAFILSMPPLLKVGGVEIPTPSILLRAIAPPFRFYCRWGLVVTFALTLLAGIGFALAARSARWSRGVTAAVCVALLALFFLDTSIIPPLRSKDIARPPAVISRLSELPDEEPVAVYPLKPGIYNIPQWYQYYQQFHRHPMLNGVKVGTVGDLYLMVMNDIYAPYTPAMLSGLGIEKVAVLNDFFEMATGEPFEPALMPDGYRLVEKTSDGYIFDVTAEPAEVYPLFYTNFTVPRMLPDGRAWAEMVRDTGEILLVNKGGEATYEFSAAVFNPGEQAVLELALDGAAVARSDVPPGAGRIALPLPTLTGKRHVLTLKWSGGAVTVEGRPSPVYLMLSRPEMRLLRAGP